MQADSLLGSAHQRPDLEARLQEALDGRTANPSRCPNNQNLPILHNLVNLPYRVEVEVGPTELTRQEGMLGREAQSQSFYVPLLHVTGRNGCGHREDTGWLSGASVIRGSPSISRRHTTYSALGPCRCAALRGEGDRDASDAQRQVDDVVDDTVAVRQQPKEHRYDETEHAYQQVDHPQPTDHVAGEALVALPEAHIGQ